MLIRFVSLPVLLLCSVACGGQESEVEDSGSPEQGTCVNSGDVSGCLVYESDSCDGDISLNSAKGGYHAFEGSHLFIELAGNNDNVEITFEIVDTMGLVDNVTYTIPDQLILTITDTTDPDDPIVYFGCDGELTVTSYTEGEAIHGEFTLGAATTAGTCGLSEWYTGQGSFSDLTFCDVTGG